METISFKEINFKFFFPAGEENLMTLLLHLPGKMLKKVYMRRVTDVDEDFHFAV